MPATPALGDPAGAVPARGPRPRAAAPGVRDAGEGREAPGELAVRVRALRRARRDARTRASRVRRVLLAPTVPDETYPPRPRPWHQN